MRRFRSPFQDTSSALPQQHSSTSATSISGDVNGSSTCRDTDIAATIDGLMTYITGADLCVDDLIAEMRVITLPKAVAAAIRFREILADGAVEVCAVCSTFCRPSELFSKDLLFNALPGTDLLRTDGPKTAELPRDALTTATINGCSYCIQPDAVDQKSEEATVTVCQECHSGLSRGCIPPASLVRFDEGPWPIGPTGIGLETMTLVESTIVAPLRAFRLLLVCRAAGNGARSADTLQRAMRGNVVAIPKSTPAQFASIFPCRVEDIPWVIHVILIAAASTKQRSKELAKKVAALHVRGPLCVLWARHTENVLRDCPAIRLDENALQAYETINEVPDSVAEAVQATSSEAEAEHAWHAVRKRRAGYAATRYGSAIEEAAATTDDPAERTDEEFMRGLDDIEMELPSTQSAGGIEALVAGIRNGNSGDENEQRAGAADILRDGGVLAVSTSNSSPFSDYDKRWGPLVHVMAFPNGTGQCPEKGMSLETWFRHKLRRYPRRSNGQQVAFILDFFNIIQRHQVNTQVSIQMRLSPQLFRDLQTITDEEVILCARIAGSGMRGRNLANALNSATPAVRALFKAFRSASSRVLGSPQSFASLRSKAMAGWYIFGEWSMALNINPSELNARVCFELAGTKYSMDEQGRPGSDAPTMADRWRIIAGNPVAVAEFFHLYLVAFSDAYLGWPEGAEFQVICC